MWSLACTCFTRSAEPPAPSGAALEAIRPAAEAKDVRLQSVLEPVIEPVHGDPARLQQIVWNLLFNAVKFTPRGGRVQVVLARVNSHVEITVSDTGKGIRPEFLPHVFERFRQGDSSAAREHGGLGLSIVKQLVELHGGSVRAASDGEGRARPSRFTFRSRALLAGYQTHLAKPVEPTELLATVAALAQKTGADASYARARSAALRRSSPARPRRRVRTKAGQPPDERLYAKIPRPRARQSPGVRSI